MNAIITVVGCDKVGIIAQVSAFLAKHSINIADITQTILSGNFVMMMVVNMESSDISVGDLREKLIEEGRTMQVEINIMNEKVFTSMHRV
jgi:ACT domain-containing protein